MDDYPIPLPEENPTGALVMVYKLKQGIEWNNRSWDITHWARASHRVSELKAKCKGDPKLAEECLIALADKFNESDIFWNLETILNHADRWLAQHRGTDGESNIQGFRQAVADQRAKRHIEQPRSIDTGSSVSDPLPDLPNVPGPHKKDDHRRTNRSNEDVLHRILQDTSGDRLEKGEKGVG